MAQTVFKSTQLAASPSATKVLTTDGEDNAWTAASGIVTPGGADTNVQFNDGGAFGGEAGLVYAKATDHLHAAGAVTTLGSINAGQQIVGAAGTITSSAYVSAGTYVDAGSYVTAATYVEANDDIRLTSDTANSGGGYQRIYSEATSGALAGPVVTIQVNVPTGSRLLGCQLRVDTAVTGPPAWDAAYSGGATQSIVSGGVPAKNTKYSVMFDPNLDTPIAAGEVDVDISAFGPNFTGGVIRAIVYYETFIAMGNNP